MGTLHYRPDYAKFLVECPPQHWQLHYGYLNEQSHQRKYSTEWLKSHKVNRLWYNAAQDMETWSIDIWGEWAGIVEMLPLHWLRWLRRFDVRAIVWDATGENVESMGMHLYQNVTSHNIHVFNTRPATKRLGRDRGGVGFAIGSHKSDLRIAVYKRTGEQVAQEFQMSGTYLRRIVQSVLQDYEGTESVRSPWLGLVQRVKVAGLQRLGRVLDSAGIGQYWPVYGPDDLPGLPPVQASFGSYIPDEEGFPDEEDTTRPDMQG